MLKKIKYFLLSAVLAFTLTPFIAAGGTQTKAVAEEEVSEGHPMPFKELTADELVYEMGVGWNYGNRFDSGSGDNGWGNPRATKEFFKKVHDLGYNTVRVPVTWNNNIGSNEPYTVRADLLDRVQDVVDYIIEQGMYVAINMHHDGGAASGWISNGVIASYPNGNAATWQKAQDRFYAAWKQIAERFKDYDEHLLFEALNEVAGNDGSATGIKRDTAAIMVYNQLFTNAVRETGSNNVKRWLIVGARYTNIATSSDKSNGFKFPEDPWNATNKFMFQVHDYDQYLGLSNPPSGEYTKARAREYAGSIQKVVEGFTSKGIPVWFGEYGAGRQDGIYENGEEATSFYFEVMVAYMSSTNMVPVVWDNGSMGKGGRPGSTTNDNFALIDRMTGEAYRPKGIEAMMRGNEFYKDVATVQVFSAIGGDDHNFTTVVPLTDLEVSDDAIDLRVGSDYTVGTSFEPANTNDPLIWSTDDATVATVYKGHIQAKGVGQTTVHVYAQSNIYDGNNVSKDIVVTVYPDTGKANAGATLSVEAPAAITGTLWTTSSGITFNGSGYAQPCTWLNVSASGLRRNDHLYYRSSDNSVATVNGVGKVTGISAGKAYITVYTESGLSAQVQVTVGNGNTAENELTAASEISLTAEEPVKELTVTAAGTGKVYFVSSDPTVAFPSAAKGVEVTEGKATVKVIAASAGTATITAYSANGETATTTVTVGEVDFDYDDVVPYYSTEPSAVAPVVEITMPETVYQGGLAAITYNTSTENADVTEDLDITVSVTNNGWAVDVYNNCITGGSLGATYLVRVKATDQFGNSSFDSLEVKCVKAGSGVNIDKKTPPTVTVEGAEVAPGENTELVFTVGTTNESIPEGATYEVTVSVTDGENYVEVTEENGKYYFTPDKEGEYTVEITAIDAFGNSTTETATISVNTPNTGSDSGSNNNGTNGNAGGGCGGSVSATGIFGVLILAGFAIAKKRK
ncbi:MAG: cellulase family glycosylhydrolase [Clostridia bacterium]|nr:cellulase family glycosylhydrolase [Clostridia bacterium]